MYEIIVKEDFVDLISELPLKYIAFLNASFVRVRKIENDKTIENDNFLDDLIRQIRDKELE